MKDQTPPEELLRGMQFDPLPMGWTPVDAILLIKCFDEDGHPTWCFRTTDSMNDEELLGALTVRIELLKRKLLEDYTDSDDE